MMNEDLVDEEVTNSPIFTIKSVSEALIAADKLSDLIFEIDPNMDRCIMFKREMNDLMVHTKKS